MEQADIGASGRATHEPSPDGLGHSVSVPDAGERPVYCSFCGKPNTEVAKMIAGPANIFICSECVSACTDIIGQSSWAMLEVRVKTFAENHGLTPTLGLIGEMAWALGMKPDFSLVPAQAMSAGTAETQAQGDSPPARSRSDAPELSQGGQDHA